MARLVGLSLLFVLLAFPSAYGLWPFSFSEKDSTDSPVSNIFKIFNSDLTALPSTQSLEFLPPGNNEEFSNAQASQGSNGEGLLTGSVSLGDVAPKQKQNRLRLRGKQSQGQAQPQHVQGQGQPQAQGSQQVGSFAGFLNPFANQNAAQGQSFQVIDENGQPLTLSFANPQQSSQQQPRRSFNPLKWVFPALITIGGHQQQQQQQPPLQTVMIEPNYFQSQPQQQHQPQQQYHQPQVVVSQAAVPKPKVTHLVRQQLGSFPRTRTVLNSGVKGNVAPQQVASTYDWPQQPGNAQQHGLSSSEPQYGYRVANNQQSSGYQEQPSKPKYVLSSWDQVPHSANPVVRVFNILNDTGYHHQIVHPNGYTQLGQQQQQQQQLAQQQSSSVGQQSSVQSNVQPSSAQPSSQSSQQPTTVNVKPQLGANGGGGFENDASLEGFESRPMPTYVASTSKTPEKTISMAENGYATKREDVQLPSFNNVGSSSSNSEAQN